jgi:hypothetical protein
MNRETKISFIKGILNGTIDRNKIDVATLLPKEKNFDAFTDNGLAEYITLIECYNHGRVLTEVQFTKLKFYTDQYTNSNE